MHLGITVPCFDHQYDLPTITSVARRVEAAGFASLWFADHVTGPSPMGASVWYDTITLMSHVAALIPRVWLGTDVIVVGHRHPVLAAKMLATLDIVSGGRLIIGAGTGYLPKEFAELGAPFEERGAYSDECVQVWKAMWADDPIAVFQGRWFDLSETMSLPKPVQRPHPPIWFGSSAPPVWRRVVAHGDGWHPIGLSVDEYARGQREIAALAAAAGRDLSTITWSYSATFGSVSAWAQGDDRRVLSGSLSQIRDDLTQLGSLGVSHVVFRIGTPTASNDQIAAQIDRLAELVAEFRGPV